MADDTVWSVLGRFAAEHAPFDEVWPIISKKREWLKQLAEKAYTDRCRIHVHGCEVEAFTPQPALPDKGQERVERALNLSSGIVPIEQIRDSLAEKGFRVEGEYVMWEDATAEQHEARAEQQERTAAGFIRTAERHRIAAKMIREAGVTCLREIGGA